ncbi:MAG: isopeptide-forming domain-containing fimbrial protein [Lachnospiraceae bacterium]|nr:isopeptide-forming domain-containing fimbrial protein [Lachnospiraceae bacterium]
MKKLWKRFGAIAMMVVLVLTMALPVMAAGTNSKTITGTPSASDTGKVEISGLTEGDTVTFYQIVKANYDASGFLGYEAVKDNTIALFDKDGNAIYPSAEQITALALDPSGLKSEGPVTAEGATVSRELAAGEWLVVVTPEDATTIYNPLVASVYYTGEGGKTIESGKVDAGETYTINGTSSYVKKSTTDVDKKITGGKYEGKEEERTVAGEHGDDLAIGDTINFQIDSTIPAYSDEYKNLEYEISDTMDAGLDFNQDSLVITVGGASVDAKNYDLTKEAHGFKIAFKEDYLRDLAAETETARKVVVTYSGTLNKDATTNFDANQNTVKITFTNKPGENQKAEEIEKKTYQYTFEIDGSIGGTDTTRTHKTHELIKTGEGGSVADGTIIDDGWSETTVTSPLSDAEFTLTNTTTGKVYTAKTDASGYMNFKGLDAGSYTLKETKAPDGYSLNSKEIPVVISADYNTDGTLKSYTITVDGNNTSTYEAKYASDNSGNVTEVHEEAVKSTEIKNTKMNNLPSTGGMGTYLFTFVGAVLIVLGVIVHRRNKAVK